MSEGSTEYETVLELCQSKYRRVILAVLTGEQRALTVNDLAKTIVEQVHQKSVSETSKDEITQIQVSLHHVHLPKLAEAGLVTWDPDGKLVEPTEQLEHMRPQPATLIEFDPELEIPLEL